MTFPVAAPARYAPLSAGLEERLLCEGEPFTAYANNMRARPPTRRIPTTQVRRRC